MLCNYTTPTCKLQRRKINKQENKQFVKKKYHISKKEKALFTIGLGNDRIYEVLWCIMNLIF